MQYSYIFLGIYGFILLYFGWYIFLSIIENLNELGRQIDSNSKYYFDVYFKGAILATLLARIFWVISHFYDVLDVGFFYLPYVRDGWHFEFLTYYPWRFLRVWEGLSIIIFIISFWIYVSIFIVFYLFPEIQHLRIKNEVVKHNLLLKLIFWWLGFSAYCFALCMLIR